MRRRGTVAARRRPGLENNHAPLVGGRRDVPPVLELLVVKNDAREERDGRVHAVLGVEEVDRLAGRFEPLEQRPLVQRDVAALGEGRRRELLRVAHQHALFALEEAHWDEGGQLHGLGKERETERQRDRKQKKTGVA